MSILKVIYTLIAIYDLEAEVFDIVTTYFNVDVFKDVIIYIQQLYGLKIGIGCTCRLLKVLYSLRSSPKWWYDTIVPVLEKYGFEAFVSNICYFINKDKDVFFYFYIDDIIVIAPTKALIAQTKKKLAGVFEMKKLGELCRYLSYWIDRNQEERFIYIS